MPRCRCLLAPVLAAQFGHRCVAVAGHVFHPLGHFLHRAGAHIAADVGFAAQHLAEVEELVRAEGVVFDGASPIVVAQGRSLVTRTDAVHPVIVVGKAAARPSQHGHVEVFHGLKHIVAITLGVGDGGVFAHPQTAVDAGSEVFGKLSVDFLVDFLSALVGMDGGCCVLGIHAEGERCRKERGGNKSFHDFVELLSDCLVRCLHAPERRTEEGERSVQGVERHGRSGLSYHSLHLAAGHFFHFTAACSIPRPAL